MFDNFIRMRVVSSYLLCLRSRLEGILLLNAEYSVLRKGEYHNAIGKTQPKR